VNTVNTHLLNFHQKKKSIALRDKEHDRKDTMISLSRSIQQKINTVFCKDNSNNLKINIVEIISVNTIRNWMYSMPKMKI
jgi:hypothetical protein